MSRQVDLTYLGDNPAGPRWQAQPLPLNGAFGQTQAETREAFVAAWNAFTGDQLTEDDFEFTQNSGPTEDEPAE